MVVYEFKGPKYGNCIIKDYKNPSIDKVELYFNDNTEPFITTINYFCIQKNNETNNFNISLSTKDGNYNDYKHKYYFNAFYRKNNIKLNELNYNNGIIELSFNNLYDVAYNVKFGYTYINCLSDQILTSIESNNDYNKSNKIKIKIFFSKSGTKGIQEYFSKNI
jgi:hypothetical protein